MNRGEHRWRPTWPLGTPSMAVIATVYAINRYLLRDFEFQWRTSEKAARTRLQRPGPHALEKKSSLEQRHFLAHSVQYGRKPRLLGALPVHGTWLVSAEGGIGTRRLLSGPRPLDTCSHWSVVSGRGPPWGGAHPGVRPPGAQCGLRRFPASDPVSLLSPSPTPQPCREEGSKRPSVFTRAHYPPLTDC